MMVWTSHLDALEVSLGHCQYRHIQSEPYLSGVVGPRYWGGSNAPIRMIRLQPIGNPQVRRRLIDGDDTAIGIVCHVKVPPVAVR